MEIRLMKRLLALAFLASGMATAGVWAAQGIDIRAQTAGDLAEICAARPGEPAADAKINFCLGFAQGVIDLDLEHAGDKKPFCIPRPGPSRRETMTQFARWVGEASDRRSMPAAAGVIRFMGERFPCK
jgi:Rap1a immunity proteins